MKSEIRRRRISTIIDYDWGSGGGSISNELTFAESVEIFGLDWQWQERVPNGPFETGFLYDPLTGKSLLAAASPWNTKYRSYGILAWYDPKDGFTTGAIDCTKWNDGADNHLTTKIAPPYNGKYYLLQELDHSSINVLWESSKETLNFNEVWSEGNYARGIFWQDTTLGFRLMVQRDAETLSLLNFNGVGFDAAINHIVPNGVGKRVYPYRPLGVWQDNQGYFYDVVVNATSFGFEEYFLRKTLDWDTWTNYTGSHSFTISSGGTRDADYLRTNGYKICGVDNSVNNLADFQACIKPDGTFAALFYKDYEEKLYFISNNGTSFVETEITLPLEVAGATVSGMLDGQALQQIFWRDDKYYTLCRVVDGSYFKIHVFSSPDGLSWTDLGDVTPGVDENIHRAKLPENIDDIPNQANTAIYSCKYTYQNGSGGPAQIGIVYGLKCSFGEIQPEVPTVYTPYSNLSTDLAWKCALRVENITELGGVISAISDSSGSGNTPTVVGGQMLYREGSIQSFGPSYLSLPINNFRTDSQFYVVIVARPRGNTWMPSFGSTSDSNDYLGLKIVGGAPQHYVRRTSADFDTSTGHEALIGNEYGIYEFCSNGTHLEMRLNGVVLNKAYTDDALRNYLSWANYYNVALGNMLLGACISGATTTEYTPLDFKDWFYMASVPTEEVKGRVRTTLAQERGITLNQLGTATTYEPEAEDAFAQMSPAPTTQQKENINELFTSIKAGQNAAFGYDILPLGTHSLQNLFNNIYVPCSFDDPSSLIQYCSNRSDWKLVKSGSPIFTVNQGIKSDLVAGYYKTGFKQNSHSRFPVNAFSWGQYIVTDVASGNKATRGVRQTTPTSYIGGRLFARNASDQAAFYVSNGPATIASITSTIGFYSAEKTGGTTTTVRKDLTTNTGVTSAGAGIDREYYLCGTNVNDSSVESLSDAIIAFDYTGSYLIDEVALRTSVRDWLTNVMGVTGI